jgi:DNA-binding protein H-NS
MKKTLITSLFVIIFITNQLNGQEKPKTNEELVAEFMQLDQQVEKEKQKQREAREKTEAVQKLGKTVDELAKTLGVDK